MKVIGSTERNHRTALFVDVGDTAQSAPNFIGDRVQRLLQSLNGDGIKTDVFAARGSAIQRVKANTLMLNDLPNNDKLLCIDDMSEWAAAEGYEQVLFSIPAGRQVN